MTKQKSFVKEIDFTKEELLELIDLGLAFKELEKKRILQERTRSEMNFLQRGSSLKIHEKE